MHEVAAAAEAATTTTVHAGDNHNVGRGFAIAEKFSRMGVRK